MPPNARVDESGQGGYERSVGPAEAGSGDLTAQDGQLLAEHEDLRGLGEGVHPMDAHELEDLTDQAVEEAKRHGPAGSPFRSCRSSSGSGCWTLRAAMYRRRTAKDSAEEISAAKRCTLLSDSPSTSVHTAYCRSR